MAGRSSQPIDPDLLDALVQTSFTVAARLSEVAAAHDMSLTQLRVLGILRDRELQMAELAGYLGLDRSSVTGLIDRGVARGLVRRAASADDGRVVRVSLTPAGRRLGRRVVAEVTARLEPTTYHLTAAEQQRLGRLLAKLLGE